MKKMLKKILIFMLIVPCLFIFSACNEKMVVDVSQSVVDGQSIYTVTYNDGTTNTLVVKNGVDGEKGKDLTVQDLYSAAQQNGFSGSLLDFIEQYLSSNTTNESSVLANINKSLLTTVCVSCEFPVITTSFWSESKSTALSDGTGIIISLDKENGDAYILTNYHVVYYSEANGDHMSTNIKCFLYGSPILRSYKLNGNQYATDENGFQIVEYGEKAIDCEYVGGSLIYDIAVLKISGSDVLKNSSAIEAVFADSNDLMIGETVYAIGNAKGLGISVTKGIISTDNDEVQRYAADETTVVQNRSIRIDAAVNNGNSGGGVYNERGQVVGIVNFKIIEDNVEDIGFAIPSNVAIRVAKNILRNYLAHNKKAFKAVFGITVKKSNFKAVYDANLGRTILSEELSIEEIAENGVFAGTNLEVGDIILGITIDGTYYSVTRFFHIAELTWLLDEGDVVSLHVQGKEPITVQMSSEAFSEIQ